MMKKIFFMTIVIGLIITSCNNGNDKKSKSTNPFFSEFHTPFNTPDFDIIELQHYLPAFKEGMKQQNNEIKAIIDNSKPPTFENTLETYEKSGSLLRKVEGVFDNMTEANTNEELQEISIEVAPLLAKHTDDINLNDKLFKRIKSVYEQKEKLDLTGEQNRLLDKIYKKFVRGGANLNPESQGKLRKTNEKLSVLSIKFGENLLAETNDFTLIIDKESDLAGLPQSTINASAETSNEKEMQGKWVFTLDKPSMIPFLQYADNRDLREKIFNAYINRGNNNNENDNKKIISEIVNLRIEKAHLLGYNNHAEFILEKNMAKNPDNVYKLLTEIWEAALPVAKKEAQELQGMINKDGKKFKLEPWDWWYYSSKLKQEKYAIDEEEIRPYFQLENVRDGAFELANRLYGLEFIERNDIPTYHEDVLVYEIREADGSHVGIFYLDYFPRSSKRGGAWMEAYRKQSGLGDERISPIICNVCNFTKPSGDQPALLSFEEVETLFHEFGHALHGFLSNCQYNYLSGTSVSRDFVEMPSQIMENWVPQPEMLQIFAKHYKTGEVIPKELVDKIQESGHFNQGFITTEYLAAAFLDMDYHTLTETQNINVEEFEKKSMKKMGMIPEIVVRYRGPYFAHIFSGGYSSGYYSYIWSAVLDTDAFQEFKENGLFDKKTASLFRENVISKGGTEDPMKLYLTFRGAEPKVDALLKKRGLK